MDPGEESFSLSSRNFSSSFKFYSSEDDEDQDVDTYIEFELGPTTTALVNEYDDKDFEFRISTSVPGFVPSPKVGPVANNSSLQEDGGDAGNCTSPLFRIFRNRNRSDMKMVGDRGGDRVTENWELVPSRKTSSKVISTQNGGVMRLLLKLRSILTGSQTNKCKPSRWKITNLMKPIDKLFNNWHLVVVKRLGCEKSTSKTFSEESKIVDVFRKMFVTNRRIRGNRVLGQIAHNRVSSIESSPIHQQSTDATASSVHAAIAHCKRSLGQPEDFCF